MRMRCWSVVALLAGASDAKFSQPIPGSTWATRGMDIFRRGRIQECGLAVAKSMGNVSYATSRQVQRLWARRLDLDLGDFDAVRASDDPKILWSVATLRSSPEREAWVAAQRSKHPYLRILNATDKGEPIEKMAAHYDALGLRAAWELSYGQVAWFLT